MKPERKEKLHAQVKLISTFLKFALLVLIIVGIPLYIYFFQHQLIEDFSSIESVKELINRYEANSILVYICAQTVQIVICIIPGQMLQIAAGIGWGFWLAYLFSIIGAFIGSVMAYYLAKLLGRDAVHILFGEEKINEYTDKINSKRGVMLVFLIYLLPGLPKDLCGYAAGLSKMRLRVFLIISLIGRSPAMMGSLLIGKQLGIGGYTSAIIIGLIALILFIICVIFRRKIIDWTDKIYAKLIKL